MEDLKKEHSSPKVLLPQNLPQSKDGVAKPLACHTPRELRATFARIVYAGCWNPHVSRDPRRDFPMKTRIDGLCAREAPAAARFSKKGATVVTGGLRLKRSKFKTAFHDM